MATEQLTSAASPGEVVSSLAAHASREYLLEYGWRSEVRGDEILLEVDDGMAAVVVPADWALTAMADLGAKGLSCPVVLLPDGIRPYCVFLLEDSSSAHGGEPLPAWLWLPWRAGEGVPLPADNARSALRWLRPPEKAVGGAVSVAVLREVLARRFDGRAVDRRSA